MHQKNEWGVSYSSISFVERALNTHTKVASFERSQDIFFRIKLTDDRTINMVLVDEYTLGLAAVHRVLDEFPGAEYVVTTANWNAYTREAKQFGNEHEIGIFIIGEFIGALNMKEPKKYVQKDDDGNPIYHYRAA